MPAPVNDILDNYAAERLALYKEHASEQTNADRLFYERLLDLRHKTDDYILARQKAWQTNRPDGIFPLRLTWRDILKAIWGR